uniref:Uncharacterized protein n=1 Tax=Ursus americanus TaxID=9643 RepID=A0A452QXZ9_URSAM
MTILGESEMAAIWQALNHYAYRDAVFLAERLYPRVGLPAQQGICFSLSL